ncbi:MAG: TSUP family transporter, partial [Desulfofustis sp.]|nr:TSUP family transporter [Desulfofustis sp.]
TLGYLVSGWQATALPPDSIGYIYLPALVGIAAVSILTAPLGARLAHSLPVSRLRKIFAVMLILIGTRMLFSIF